MTGEAITMIGGAFTACWQWFVSIVNRIDAFGYILSGIIIMFIVSLFLMPFRGGSIIGGDFGDFVGGMQKQQRNEVRSGKKEK